MKVSELEGAMLDYWVAKALNHKPEIMERMDGSEYCHIHDWNKEGAKINGYRFEPHFDWDHCGPLIEKYEIYITPAFGGSGWIAGWSESTGCGDYVEHEIYGNNTPQQAICRAVVASVYGDEVDD